MRRYNPPFNGNRYVLNRNTHEVHDLDREVSACRINEIKADHIRNYDTYAEVQIASVTLDNCNCNGCAFCMPEKNTG